MDKQELNEPEWLKLHRYGVPVWQCPSCHEVVASGAAKCPHCGWENNPQPELWRRPTDPDKYARPVAYATSGRGVGPVAPEKVRQVLKGLEELIEEGWMFELAEVPRRHKREKAKSQL